jgi:hypothetical protein
MSHRSTFSLAQIFLLTMLSGLLCAWLRESVEWSQKRWTYLQYYSEISDDGTLFFSHNDNNGVAMFQEKVPRRCDVYETASGKHSFTIPLEPESFAVFNGRLKQLYVSSSQDVLGYDLVTHNVVNGESWRAVPPKPVAEVRWYWTQFRGV